MARRGQAGGFVKGAGCRDIQTRMERARAIATLKAHEAELKQLGVQRLYLFGSTARDEARPESDVDLFFDYDRTTFSLFDLLDVKERASGLLGRTADNMIRDSLHERLRPDVESSAVRIF